MDYAKAFRTCRVAFGLQQKELAQRAGIGASYLSLIEAGKRTPTTKSLEGICRALGIPIHLLMLLASEPADLQERPEKELDQLSRALLDLLVKAGKDEEGVDT